MVHCYEGLFITLQLRDYGIIIIILCVRAIPMIQIVRSMPHSWGKPLLTGWFGILTASQLCVIITHKPIEAYRLEAALDYSGGDQPV